ncbi:MAG: oligopeptide transporter, OPT family [Gammaproteobacteria bacterium]|nr:oligopeptide transporter, OPT family [Gammaproteobacteria bacterium]
MSNDPLQGAEGPVIPASQTLPEITFRSIIIGTILTIVLAAANAYLGLKMGQTVSASIPAAIISMSILRFFKNANMLENTMVQTMASVGESLIAGITFIMPALIILHVWSGFPYWQTVGIALLGGILGVLFTIPLRRALLSDRSLRYPEGVAISNVLKASAESKATDMRALTWGGIVGAMISLFQTGFQVLTDTFDFWMRSARTVYGFELGLSPALIAAGYIVGVNVAISFTVGITIGWLAGVPLLTAYYGLSNSGSATAIAMATWKEHIRYIGVGTMLIGGLWTLVSLFQPIVQSISASFASLREAKHTGKAPQSLRTERDIPVNYVMWGVLLLLVPLFLLIAYQIVPLDKSMTSTFHILICAFAAVYVLIGGFLFCSISSYFAGLIGSSNTPVSGLLISALLILCLAILGLFGFQGGIAGKEMFGVILAIGSSVVICVALAISNDTMQDLKVGQIVGATPWKQQLMLVLGVLVSAFVVPPILDLLYNAYGIGGVFPHAGMNESQMLAAPQAGLMAAVANGVYSSQLEWTMIIIGAVLAVICIAVDETVKRRWGLRLPVLAVGLGVYLPMNTTIPVVIGGMLSWIIDTRLKSLYRDPQGLNKKRQTQMSTHRHRGLLLACGIVAGSSIMGVILAIPFAIKQSSDALKIMPEQYQYLAGTLSIIVIACLCAWIYRVVMKKDVDDVEPTLEKESGFA